MNWLMPALGADLFKKGNYNHHLMLFLVNGGHTMTHFRECWECPVT